MASSRAPHLESDGKHHNITKLTLLTQQCHSVIDSLPLRETCAHVYISVVTKLVLNKYTRPIALIQVLLDQNVPFYYILYYKLIQISNVVGI